MLEVGVSVPDVEVDVGESEVDLMLLVVDSSPRCWNVYSSTSSSSRDLMNAS